MYGGIVGLQWSSIMDTNTKFYIKCDFFLFVKIFFINKCKIVDYGCLFRYHDMPDVIDFLVLQHFYNEAKEQNWQPGA